MTVFRIISIDHPYDGEIMQILEALQCKNIIRHEEVSRILEHVSGGESVGDVVFGTMYLAHRGSEDGCWSRAAEAELATTNTAPPSAEAEPAPASSLQPPALGPTQVDAGGGAERGGAGPSTHNTQLY